MNVYGQQVALERIRELERELWHQGQRLRDMTQAAKQLLECSDHADGCNHYSPTGGVCSCKYERAVADYLRARNPMGGE